MLSYNCSISMMNSRSHIEPPGLPYQQNTMQDIIHPSSMYLLARRHSSKISTSQLVNYIPSPFSTSLAPPARAPVLPFHHRSPHHPIPMAQTAQPTRSTQTALYIFSLPSFPCCPLDKKIFPNIPNTISHSRHTIASHTNTGRTQVVRRDGGVRWRRKNMVERCVSAVSDERQPIMTA